MGIVRSLAFTALLELFPEFRGMDARAGDVMVAELVDAWKAHQHTAPPRRYVTFWDFAKAWTGARKLLSAEELMVLIRDGESDFDEVAKIVGSVSAEENVLPPVRKLLGVDEPIDEEREKAAWRGRAEPPAPMGIRPRRKAELDETYGEMRQRAAEELAREFGNDPEEWLV